jgi:hypothetical protein
MGQLITVVEKRSKRPNVVRYEINRPLSGMGHERYSVAAPVEGDRPVDELARRLLVTGQVSALHINGSMITVELAPDGRPDGLLEIVRDLFQYYREGVQPTIL